MRDHRLDLGRYLSSNPFNRNGQTAKKLNFNDLFASKPEDGRYPWMPSHFDAEDLTRRAMTKKPTLNPDLNYLGNSSFWNESQGLSEGGHHVFGNDSRFRRNTYDFNEGRPLTSRRPQDQPDFNPIWMEAYLISPTVSPDKRAKNKMPRLSNPDPNGYIQARAESEANPGEPSVAELLSRRQNRQKNEQRTNARAGRMRNKTKANETVDTSSPDQEGSQDVA